MRRSKIRLRHAATGIVVTLATIATISITPALATATTFRDNDATSGNIAVGIRGGNGGEFHVYALGATYHFEEVSTEGGLIGIGTPQGSFTTLTFHGVSVLGQEERCEVYSPGSPVGTIKTKPLSIELVAPDEIEFKPASGKEMFGMVTRGEACGLGGQSWEVKGTFNVTVENPTSHSASHVLRVSQSKQDLLFGVHELSLVMKSEMFTPGGSLFWAE